jgi:uncharacterized membrane protein
MAELNVEPKNKSPWWIWLIIALVIIVALFFVLGNDDNTHNDRENVHDNTGTSTTAMYIEKESKPSFSYFDLV